MKATFMAFSISLAAIMNSCDQGVQPEPICSAVALDSTSHAFSWTITELGDGGGSILNDVAIINDELIYAVGELYLRDSAGQIDPRAYNAARWNGTNWSPLRIPTEAFGGSLGYYPIKAVFAFGENDIWMFSTAGSYSHWNGSDWQTKYVAERSGGGLKFWGGSSSNLYLVGTNGSISFYNGTAWQQVSSGTTLPIRDIWGSTDPVTGEQTILAIASGSSPEEGRQLLSLNGTTVTHLPVEGLSWVANGIWFVPNCQYYVVGAGIHQKSILKDPAWSVYPSGVVTSYESGGVRGSALNNVFVVGSFMEVVHFNGSSWYNYRNEIPFTSGALGGMAVTDDLVVAVGLNGQKAIAVIGRR